MTRWKMYLERRLRKENALHLLTLSGTVRPADMEPRYLGRERAVGGRYGKVPASDYEKSVWRMRVLHLRKLETCKAESGMPSNGGDKRSLDAALTEPDEACCAVELEELRASSHQRTYAFIPFASPISDRSASLHDPNVDGHELHLSGITKPSLANRWNSTCLRLKSMLCLLYLSSTATFTSYLGPR